MEFQGEFQESCEQGLIDHRNISHDHFEVNGLAKRMIETMKKVIYGNMDCYRVIHVIMTCICHGWPWDIKKKFKKILSFNFPLFSTFWVCHANTYRHTTYNADIPYSNTHTNT